MSEINEMVFVHLLTCPHRREHLKHAQKQLYFSAIALLIEVVLLRNVNDSKKSATRSFWGISAKKCSLLNYIRVIGANKKQLRSKNWGHSLRWNIEY